MPKGVFVLHETYCCGVIIAIILGKWQHYDITFSEQSGVISQHCCVLVGAVGVLNGYTVYCNMLTIP